MVRAAPNSTPFSLCGRDARCFCFGKAEPVVCNLPAGADGQDPGAPSKDGVVGAAGGGAGDDFRSVHAAQCGDPGDLSGNAVRRFVVRFSSITEVL